MLLLPCILLFVLSLIILWNLVLKKKDRLCNYLQKLLKSSPANTNEEWQLLLGLAVT